MYRSLLCTELPLGRIPQNIPENFIKILTEIPQAAFSTVGALAFLWLNLNNKTLMDFRSLRGLHNLTEFRIQGNQLCSIPWTAFRDTPNLEILDLKHNRISVFPGFAEYINTISPPIILMNSYMRCSAPESRAGKFFHEVELKTCMNPETSIPQTNTAFPVGSDVTLSCSVKSRPEAFVRWSYTLGRKQL